MRKNRIASYGRLLLLSATLATVSVGALSARAAETKASAAAPTGVERLVAIEEISQMKYQWWANMDNKRWNDALELFTSPDAPIDLGLKFPDGKAVDTAKKFVEFSPGFFGSRKGLHSGHNPVITFKSATEAEGTWQFDAVYWSEADGKLSGAPMYYWGYHFDRYIKTSKGWRIAATRFEAVGTPLGKSQ